MLTDDQYRVLNEVLAQHRASVAYPTHETLTFARQYKLIIKGTAHDFKLSKDEMTILEILLSADRPLSLIMVRNDSQIIRDLNNRVRKQLKRNLIDVGDAGFALVWEQPKTETTTIQEKAQAPTGDLALTAKEKLLVESIFAARDQFLSYEQIAFIMAWTTRLIPRKTSEFIVRINLANMKTHGRALLEIVRGKGVRVDRSAKTALPDLSEIVRTPFGAFSLTGAPLLLAKTLDFNSASLRSNFLDIDQEAWQSTSLSQAELVEALIYINKLALQRFGNVLFKHVKITFSGYFT